ncbi:hypothetical protein TN91_25865 [Rhodococcus ruber]|nr:hypothetical protein TN91_25865 [Rhodococcus ruber]
MLLFCTSVQSLQQGFVHADRDHDSRALSDRGATALTQGSDVVAGLGFVRPSLDHLVGDGGSVDRLVSHTH